jgi:hypothetical protein
MMMQGWYQDPRFPGLMRWWDGAQWTEHTQAAAGLLPAPQPQPLVPMQPMWPASDPARDLADVAKAGQTASRFLFAGAAAYALQFIAGAFTLSSMESTMRHWIHQPRLADGSLPPVNFTSNTTATAISDLGSITLLIVGILFLIWFHRAATMAAKLGLPARRSSGWAVGGFFVPIVNFWFPYRSAKDLFPPGHPGRSMVGRWWALWIVTSFSGLAIGAVAWFSEGAAVVMAIVASGVAVGAAMTLRWVIADVTRCHTELIARRY